MACSQCGSAAISVSVPQEYRADAPSDAAAVSFCTRCLRLEPSAAGGSSEPDFSRVSDAFPTDADSAVPLALAIGLCSSLATNRESIERLLGAVERAGRDPLLVLDRLVADPSVEPAIDLERRRHQLEQLLY